eukprot:jgi/Hompol1/1368/HPOL_005107-RA
MQTLQQQLLGVAMKLLKPGGQLVYSTCTLSVEENEANIEHIMGLYPSLQIADLHLDVLGPTLPNGSPTPSCFRRAFESAHAPTAQRFPLDRALRIMPTPEYEGFFVCRLVNAVMPE